MEDGPLTEGLVAAAKEGNSLGSKYCKCQRGFLAPHQSTSLELWPGVAISNDQLSPTLYK